MERTTKPVHESATPLVGKSTHGSWAITGRMRVRQSPSLPSKVIGADCSRAKRCFTLTHLITVLEGE
eukprot:4885433-Amphidinium_carterae.1